MKEQWDRQRSIQLSVIETESEKEMLKQVEELVDLEDRLWDVKSVSTLSILKKIKLSTVHNI